MTLGTLDTPTTATQPPTLAARWAALLVRRSGAVLVGALVVLLLAGVAAAGTMDRLVLSRFESPGSQSWQVAAALQDRFGTGKGHVVLLVTARTGDVDAAPVAAAGRALAAELAAAPGVAEVRSYWTDRDAPVMRSADHRQAVVVARLAGTVTQARAALGTLSPRFTRTGPVVSVAVGGGDEVFRQAAGQARQDFLRAEAVIFPMLLLLLLAIHRRFSAALVTLLAGVFSVVLTLGVLRGITHLTDVSTFAANLTLVMGLGLAVDYGLFVITRFRQELGRAPERALEQALRTAGHTVAWSAVTVAASLAALLLFPFPFLRSFAWAGVAVVASSALAGLVVLPAALVRLAGRLGPLPAPADGGRWERLADAVTRRPVRWAVPSLLVLAVLAAPVLGLRVGVPDDRVLPRGTSSRVVQQDIRDRFPAEQIDALQVLATPRRPGGVPPGQVDAYARRLSALPAVTQVEAATGRYAQGRQVLAAGPESARFTARTPSSGTWLSVVATSRALDDDQAGVVAAVRAVPAPFATQVGGYPAELTDFRAALLARAPWVFGLVLLVSLALLTAMTRSLRLSALAVAVNAAVMAVMLGVLVWAFQAGHLAGPLGFTTLGSLEPTIPILMFCVAWGLSMDYEVFLLSRVVEERRRGRDTAGAVRAGLVHSGPVITAAAVVLAACFATYASSGITYLKMIALGMALAVLVDAVVVRAVLMPALMTLAGRATAGRAGPAPRRSTR